jgi:hypothetical protein
VVHAPVLWAPLLAFDAALEAALDVAFLACLLWLNLNAALLAVRSTQAALESMLRFCGASDWPELYVAWCLQNVARLYLRAMRGVWRAKTTACPLLTPTPICPLDAPPGTLWSTSCQRMYSPR